MTYSYVLSDKFVIAYILLLTFISGLKNVTKSSKNVSVTEERSFKMRLHGKWTPTFSLDFKLVLSALRYAMPAIDCQ